MNYKRNYIGHDTKEFVREEVLDWVRHNRGKQVPNQSIANKYKVKPHQVGQVTKTLIKHEEISKVTPNTYEITPVVTIEPKQVATIDEPTALKLSVQVEQMARQFVWETGVTTLKPFVLWLIERGE